MAVKAYFKIMIFAAFLLAAGAGAAYFFLFTTAGGEFAAEKAIARYSNAENITFEDAEGSIASGFTLRNVSAAGLKELPAGSSIAIRQIDIRVTRPGIDGIHVTISGGSLFLPTGEAIRFYGAYSGGILDLKIYSQKVALDSLITFFGLKRSAVLLAGTLSQIDLALEGTLNDLALTGTAVAQRLTYEGFSMTDAPLVCDLAFTDEPDAGSVKGALVIKTGTVSGRRTAVVVLDESRLVFTADIAKPRLDVRGRSTVEQVKIRVAVKGTVDEPDIQLFSDPLLPQEQLLVMLATGRQWAGVGTSFSQGGLAPDLAMDLFDYFVLGGSGSTIARKFGITGVSVTFDETKKGVGVTGAVSEKVEVGYGVVQTQSPEKEPEITTTVSGELKVSDTISLGVQKELKPAPASGAPADKVANDTVMIKFKKTF
ncbi:MAG: translocation/assembly module TamB domain-containing protein [Candidatus Omnitrophica bacterium]|nr:translocation/assembly module TamB domain-containing protein [Candidatus Omnitrophota bacterium]